MGRRAMADTHAPLIGAGRAVDDLARRQLNEPFLKGLFGGIAPVLSLPCLAIKRELRRRRRGIFSCLPFFSILHPLPCREGVAVAVLLRRRLCPPPAIEPRRLRKSQPPKAKATLKAEALDGATVGEAVEAEAGVEGERLRRYRLRRHLLLLRQVAMSGARLSSSSCSCRGRRAAAFVFPGRLRACWRSTSHRG